MLNTYDKNNEKRFCTRAELIHGEWKSKVLEEPPYYPFNSSDPKWIDNPNSCINSSHYKKPFHTYEWIPNNNNNNLFQEAACQFNEWNANDFCNVINQLSSQYNATLITLAFVGDSLTFEHYYSLGFSLGFDTPLESQFISKKQNINIRNLACNESVEIIYRRSDYLEQIPDIINRVNPDILVINKGAHFVKENEFTRSLNMTIKHLENWQNMKKNSTKSRLAKLFVRTSVPGMPKCEKFVEPISNITEVEAYIADPANYVPSTTFLKYNWHRFKEMNQIMLNMFNNSHISNISILDAYELAILRPDNHKHNGNIHDCLHHCIPGSTDTYNQILLHFLKQMLE